MQYDLYENWEIIDRFESSHEGLCYIALDLDGTRELCIIKDVIEQGDGGGFEYQELAYCHTSRDTMRQWLSLCDNA